MTAGPIPICESCSRLRPGPDGFGFECEAFPDGIPDEIILDGFDHREPFPGDHGVRWELDAGDPAAEARLAAYVDDAGG